VVVTHPSLDPGVVAMDPPEVWERFDSPSSVLAYAHAALGASRGFRMHEAQWQHSLPRPGGFLFCRTGVIQLHFDRPADTLGRLLDECGGAVDDRICRWAEARRDLAEAGATALALAATSARNERRALLLFKHIAEMRTHPSAFSVAVSAFLLRTVRLLSTINDIPIVDQPRPGEWRISVEFRRLDGLTASLANLVHLINEHLKHGGARLHLEALVRFVQRVSTLLQTIDGLAKSKPEFLRAIAQISDHDRRFLAGAHFDFSNVNSLTNLEDFFSLMVTAVLEINPASPAFTVASDHPPHFRRESERETELKRHCRQIQSSLEARIGRARGAPLDPQTLFDECCARCAWDLVLAVVAVAPVAGDGRTCLIHHVWSCFMIEQLWRVSLEVAREMVGRVLRLIPHASDVRSALVVVPILEELRIRKQGSVLWALETMIGCGMDQTELLHAYLDALDQGDLKNECRCEFLYAVAFLIERGADLAGKSITRNVDWFLINGCRCEFYRRVREILCRR
jgi:hypothetical protein